MNVSHPCCFVHIGAPRTGSTALEKFFCNHRDVLLQNAVLYPEVSLRGYGHHDLAFLLSGGYPDWAIPQPRPLAELAEELNGAVLRHPGHVLISSENFYLFPAIERLRALLDSTGVAAGRRVIIVVYLRRQDDAHESWFNQTVKTQGAIHDIDTCIERWRDLWDYRTRLADWATVFGPENVRVRVYDVGRFEGGSLVADFLAATGIEMGDVATTAEQVNARLNRDVLEFQRLVNQLPLQTVEKRRFFRRLSELSTRSEGRGLFDERPLLDSARRYAILDTYAAGNAEVARRFLGRDALFASPSPASAAAPPTVAGLTVEKMAYILGWLIATDGAILE